MTRIIAGLLAALMSGSALADTHGVGDAAAGAQLYDECKSCHAIVTAEGETIVEGGNFGPNLYGVAGRTAGSHEGFRFGAGLTAAGEKGLVWNAETFVAYVSDPRGFLKDYLGVTSARSKKSFKLRGGAEDIYAYLVSVAPQ